MAIDIQSTELGFADSRPRPVASEFSLWEGVKTILAPVASLKLTVVLFALSIVLIFVGTLAQVDKDIWEVIGQYFRCWFASVPFQVFVPPSFVVSNEILDAQGLVEKTTYYFMGLIPLGLWKADWKANDIPGGFWFPGGKLIGLLLAANLLTAHLIRFKAEARGARLLGGLAAIAVGCVATWIVISAGGNSKWIQNEPLIPYHTLWVGFEGLLALLALAAAYGTVQHWSQPLAVSQQAKGWFVRGLLAVVTVGLTALVGWLMWSGAAVRPSDASLRILWQLTQSAFAGVALLAGCWVVFRKKAGIVLLHAGVGLMMYYELHVALTAVETQMNIEEGETTAFVHDIRTFELAVIDKSKPGEDRVVAIPKSVILAAVPPSEGAAGKPIDVPELPFKIEVTQLVSNSHLRAASAHDKNPATAGLGIEWFAEKKKPGAGVDTDSKVDMVAAYVTLTSREGGKPLGTYLVGMLLSMSGETDTVRVGDKVYELALRPKRYYKSYQFTLKDVKAENYLGTTTARHYASTVDIIDKTRSVDEVKTIWMNNPLRFANETFYQSSYHKEPNGVEHTTLSVVANSGWMMPYVSCALVAIGMLAHFLLLLVRFLTRGDAAELSAEQSVGVSSLKAKLGMKPAQAPVTAATTLTAPEPASQWLSVAVAATLVLAAGAYIASKALPPKSSAFEYDLAAFGRIPVVYDGRIKPLETAAQSALLTISGKTVVKLGHEKDAKSITATKWMLDVIAETQAADEYEVFRIENLELHETMGVKKREGMRYSRGELRKNEAEFHKQVELARVVAKKDRRLLSVYQRKVLELSDKLSTFDNLQFAFGLLVNSGPSRS